MPSPVKQQENYMKTINYNDRLFRSVNNSESGEVDENTIFHYRQINDLVWATYQGGQILIGTLVAKVHSDGSLEMNYSHINQKGEMMTGECQSIPEMLIDGRIRLHEKWKWTCGDCSTGESTVEELLQETETMPNNSAADGLR